MTMPDTKLRDAIDSLDTGLPAQPDLAAIMAGGSRRRRLRSACLAAGVAAAAAVVPVVFLVGDRVADQAGPAQLTPGLATHGDEMRAAVLEAFPQVAMSDEVVLDSWGEDELGGSEARQSDPVQWDTVFAWRQEYDLPGLDKFTVASDRLAPTDQTGLGDVCAAASPRQADCSVEERGSLRVLVEDGLPAGDQWIRLVQVVSDGSDSELRSSVTVAATAYGATWEEAEPLLPSVDELKVLALDDRLVLPEPDRFPDKP